MSIDQLMVVIAAGGNAKSLAYEALESYSAGDLDGARERLRKAREELTRAHQLQADLLTSAAGESETGDPASPDPSGQSGRSNPSVLTLLHMHAFDIVMTAMTECEMISRIIGLFEARLSGSSREGAGSDGG